MRFLADESGDAAVVRALRAAHYDVCTVAEIAAGATDAAVLDMAMLGRRTVITEDKDFGALVFAGGAAAFGVILLRWPSRGRSALARSVLDAISARTADIAGSFVVVEPSGVRVARLPDAD